MLFYIPGKSIVCADLLMTENKSEKGVSGRRKNKI